MAPTRVNRATRPETIKGALSRAGTAPRMAALLELVELPLEVLVPEPPSLVEAESPAHCEPLPFRPGPLPAPSVKYCTTVSSR
jgi:hypothetical protein